MDKPSVESLIEDLVAANRILAAHGVVDGYGHVSVRSPERGDRYLLSRSIAPESVTAADIVEYDLDSDPARGDGRDGYLERFIHGEIYRTRADVHAVVHSHTPAVIPFGVVTVPLKPLFHMSSFIGEGVPVFEIRDTAGDATNMLIRDRPLGGALARCLDCSPAALMRGHGAVVVGADLPIAVGRSVYMELNARMQAQVSTLTGGAGHANFLSAGEIASCGKLQDYRRCWDMWRTKALEEMRA